MKGFRKSLAILFATALMVAVMAVPAFAETDYPIWSDLAGYYIQNAESSYNTISGNDVNVTLNIHSKKVNNNYLDLHEKVTVSVTSTHAVTVLEVIRQYDDAHNNLVFEKVTSVSGGEPNGYAAITDSDSYFYRIKDTSTNTEYQPSALLAKDGWMVKVNKKFPMQSNSGETPATFNGADIAHMYVVDDDVIDLYFEDANSDGTPVQFARISKARLNDNQSIAFFAEYTTTYFGTQAQGFPWTINQYSPLPYASFALYKDGTSSPVRTGNANADGRVTFTGKFDAGLYRLEILGSWQNNGIAEVSHAQRFLTLTVDANRKVTGITLGGEAQ